MKIYTKESLIAELKKISKQGWIKNRRKNNQGGIGNTLVDLLGISENNLPIPNAAEWELKTQRIDTTSLTTLFHIEPSPRALKFVPKILLPHFGWNHSEAGIKYSENEMSFRQTIHGNSHSDRGFIVNIDRKTERIFISFDKDKVDPRHEEWLNNVRKNIGLSDLSPNPYWGFNDLSNKVGTKLLNCFYVQAEVKKENGEEYYHYSNVLMLQKFSFENFLIELEKGNILVDFDARSGHNHGTKFRLRQNRFPNLYETNKIII